MYTSSSNSPSGKSVLDVHMVEVPPFGWCEHEHGFNGSLLWHLGKALFIVYTVCLPTTLCHKSCLIPIDGAVSVVVHFDYPLASNCLLVV